MVTIRLTWKNSLKVRKMFIQDTDYLTRGINISFLMHLTVDISVIKSFLERKREVNSSDDECTSNDDNYDSESTSTSGNGSKRGEYSYHDIGCPSIWSLKRYLIPGTVNVPTSLEMFLSRKFCYCCQFRNQSISEDIFETF